MSDEYSVDAKYKRDNLIDEHERYRKALEEIRDHEPLRPLHIDYIEVVDIAKKALCPN